MMKTASTKLNLSQTKSAWCTVGWDLITGKNKLAFEGCSVNDSAYFLDMGKMDKLAGLQSGTVDYCHSEPSLEPHKLVHYKRSSLNSFTNKPVEQ